MTGARGRRRAVIDIGSNAARMQIGRVADGRVLTEVFTRVPLGLGAAAFGADGQRRVIGADGRRRLCDAVRGMQLVARAMRPCSVLTVATAALREAQNRAQVVQQLRQECNAAVRVLSGRREAAIIGKYAAAAFPNAKSALNVDIGGGSVDCALVVAGAVTDADTFPIGTARAGGGAASEWRRCRDWLGKHAAAAQIVTSSGGGAAELQRHCGALSAERLGKWRRQAEGLSLDELSARWDLSPDRAAHALRAVELYKMILAATGQKEILPARGGLSEALIWQS